MHATDEARPIAVLKFGGTSVSTAERWETIARIATQRRAEGFHPVLVCSAVGGTSDQLADLIAHRDDAARVQDLLTDISQTHRQLAHDLGVAGDLVDDELTELAATLEAAHTLAELTPRTHARIMSTGEIMSTRLGAARLQREGLDARWTDARDLLEALPFEDGHVERRWLSARCDHELDETLQATLLSQGEATLTQGFIARDADTGDTVLLGRGGSDTSAAYLAARLGAERLEIWTDVDGLYSAHPGVAPRAHRLDRVTYDEAANLATLGASVLHPRSIGPVRDAGIPLHVKCTLDPDRDGTVVTDLEPDPAIRAVTHRTGLHLVRMRRDPEWQSVGFLADVAACFQEHGLSIDLLASSPSSIQATIDVASAPLVEARLDALLTDLEQVCEPEVVRDVASVSLVGTGLSRVLGDVSPALDEIERHRVGMVVPGSNDAHLTFVVNPEDTEELVRRLHEAVFPDPLDDLSPSRLSPRRTEVRR